FALLLLLLGPAELQAHFPVWPRYPVGGVGFTYHRHHLAVSGFWGSPWYGFGGYPFAAWPVYPVTNVAVFYQPQPLVVSPPIVINQPVVVVPDRQAGFRDE